MLPHPHKMVTACFDGMTLTIRGHAGAAPYGQDLVCAAVTGLVYALAQRLTELDGQGALDKPPVIKLEPGDAEITAVPKSTYAAELQGAFRLVQSGLNLLAQHYPEQIQIQDIRYKIQDMRYPPLTARKIAV